MKLCSMVVSQPSYAGTSDSGPHLSVASDEKFERRTPIIMRGRTRGATAETVRSKTGMITKFCKIAEIFVVNANAES